MSAKQPSTISFDGSTFEKTQVWSDAEFQSKEQKSYIFAATIDGFPAYLPSDGTAASVTQIFLHEGNSFVLYKRQ